MRDLLKALANAHGTPGHEEGIAQRVVQELEAAAMVVSRDLMGNVIATREGSSPGPRIMLCAHMDEVGGLVRHVDREGFVRFDAAGSHNPRVLAGSRVLIGGTVHGVVQSAKGLDESSLSVDDLYIDIGARDADEAERAGVRIGSPVTRVPSFQGLVGTRVMGKALDNRAGLCALLTAMRRLRDFPGTVVAVASCQEEVGTRGAQIAAYAVRPDLAVAIDVTFAHDTPQRKSDRFINTRLGKGPALTLKDDGCILGPRMRALVEGAAHDAGIALQYDISPGKTDAAPVSLSRGGVPTAALLVPLRYMHGGSEIVDLDDVSSLADLLCAVIRRAPAYGD